MVETPSGHARLDIPQSGSKSRVRTDHEHDDSERAASLLQTITLPFETDESGDALIATCRRVYSAAVRSAYAMALDETGSLRLEKHVRDAVKRRFSGAPVDAWTFHCATQEAFDIHRRQRKNAVKQQMKDAKAIKEEGLREAFLAEPVRYDPIVFGGRKQLERRSKGLTGPEEWKAARLLPMTTRGDKRYGGNRHFTLSPDARTCRMTMLTGTTCRQVWAKDGKTGAKVRKVRRSLAWTEVELRLPQMRGNAGRILLEVAQLAAEKRINVQFAVTATHLHVTVDPQDLPNHPERRTPIRALPGRMLGLDLNPERIGVAAVENIADPTSLDACRILDHALIDMSDCRSIGRVETREVLAAACERILSICASSRVGTIVVEAGLGKLRSAGKSRTNNRLINGWARTVLLQMLRRKAGLRGIRVVEVWGGYSTTVGNVAFELPDACAAAAEVARRGLALDPKTLAKRRSRYAKPTPEEKAEREAAKVARKAERKPDTKETLPKFDPGCAEPAPESGEEQASDRPTLPSMRLGALLERLSHVEKEDGKDRWKERGGTPSDDASSTDDAIEDWVELHRRIKAAKIGVRRPHPDASSREERSMAVHRLGRRRRRGTLFRQPKAPDRCDDTRVIRAATDGRAVNPI